MTLTHADLQGRPLTLEELHEGLFTPREVSLEEVAEALERAPVLPAPVRRVLELDALELKERDVFAARDVSTLRSAVSGSDPAPMKGSNLWAKEYFANAFRGIETGPRKKASIVSRLIAGAWLPVERIL